MNTYKFQNAIAVFTVEAMNEQDARYVAFIQYPTLDSELIEMES